MREHLAPLAGVRLVKTDLWDEARNTRILQWAAAQGAEPFGVDISPPTVRLARDAFADAPLRAAAADVRALPYRTGSIDAVYSMGTIEHFDETEHAIGEISRVLKPGGRAIVGVPNRYDPFLRAPMVAVMSVLGLYGYGYEKSYIAARAARDARAGGAPRAGRDRDPVHPRVAADARPGLPRVVPAVDRGHGPAGPAVRLARPPRAGGAPPRLSAGDGGRKA